MIDALFIAHAPAPPPANVRPFAVHILTDGRRQDLDVLAESACDAIVIALNTCFGYDESPPQILTLSAHPLPNTRRAGS